MKPAAAVLEVKKLTKAFGNFNAVKDVSFAVQKGEIFGFLGPNGAGKSTTIRIILNILKPTNGAVVLFGDATLAAHAAHKKIGYLSGDMVLDSDLTGEQYLGLVNSLYGGGHEKRTKELATLLQANLTKNIGSYSRGNRQKIGLIAALLHEPELLILDEPSSGFDPLIQETFMQLVREYRDRGGTVFMSSHILSEVQQLCDKVAFIKDGKIITISALEEIQATATKHIHVVWADEAAAKLSHKLAGLEEMSRNRMSTTFSYSGDVALLLTYFAQRHVADITIQEPDLEQLFMSYYEAKK